LELVEPTEAAALRFEAKAGPLLDQVFALAQQNRSFACARDLLLPRLVTGRLDISQVDLGDLLPIEAAA
jgi:type I restriction enzyme S subunit